MRAIQVRRSPALRATHLNLPCRRSMPRRPPKSTPSSPALGSSTSVASRTGPRLVRPPARRPLHSFYLASTHTVAVALHAIDHIGCAQSKLDQNGVAPHGIHIAVRAETSFYIS